MHIKIKTTICKAFYNLGKEKKMKLASALNLFLLEKLCMGGTLTVVLPSAFLALLWIFLF